MEIAPRRWAEPRRHDDVRPRGLPLARFELAEVHHLEQRIEGSRPRQPRRLGRDVASRPGLERLPGDQVDRKRDVGAELAHGVGWHRYEREPVDEALAVALERR